MIILYPSDALNQRRVDDNFEAEYAAMRDAGLVCHLFSHEDFERGMFQTRPPLAAETRVLYRGWMLSPSSYSQLAACVIQSGAVLITPPAVYQACHHLPGWYSKITEWTAETVVLPRDGKLIQTAEALGWGRFFVKDYVKSLNTRRGSIAESPAEIEDVLAEIEKYRGEVEGGVCLRRVESYRPESEFRYFVIMGRAVAADGGEVPDGVLACADRIASPFFSVDVAQRNDGQLRVIEVGDGQVSDRKHWPPQRLAEILAASSLGAN